MCRAKANGIVRLQHRYSGDARVRDDDRARPPLAHLEAPPQVHVRDWIADWRRPSAFCQQLAEGRYSFARWHLPLAHGDLWQDDVNLTRKSANPVQTGARNLLPTLPETCLSGSGTDQRLASRGQVLTTGALRARGVAALKRVDVSQVLPEGDLVTLALVPLVPLVMIMENQCDDVVEPIINRFGAAALTKRWNRLSRSEKSW